jgi:flagellar hook-basal body protein
MAGELSTIQSLKAVDAWIDVINANINGGVRTAFKASRLKFSGSNVDVSRAGTSTSLPLQFPEPGLQTANTVIDFSQGAITASTENTHLAIQGEGFFVIASPDLIDTTPGANFGATKLSTQGKFYVTRDGEFRTDKNGLLVNAAGYYLVTFSAINMPGSLVIVYDTATYSGASNGIRAIYNDLDTGSVPGAGTAIRLSSFLQNTYTQTDISNASIAVGCSLMDVYVGKQSLQYTSLGSTIFDIGFNVQTNVSRSSMSQTIAVNYTRTPQILTKSLEASNASMTQSVPELSLAQKLFSALTKVLQTKQTNIDGVLNLVR